MTGSSREMFWFLEGKTIIDKTWTSVARLANIRTNHGPDYSMRAAFVGYASNVISPIQKVLKSRSLHGQTSQESVIYMRLHVVLTSVSPLSRLDATA